MTDRPILYRLAFLAGVAAALATSCLPAVSPDDGTDQRLRETARDDDLDPVEPEPTMDGGVTPDAGEPLPCVDCGKSVEVTPDPDRIPGGAWGPSHHTGTSTQAALRRAVTGLLANIYNKCNRICSNGQPATNTQCRSKVDIVGSQPLSEDPTDWGARQGEFEVRRLTNGRYKVKITIRKFPTGSDGKTAFKAKQECKAC